MKCPVCKTWTFTLETRLKKDGTKRRRYECANGHRFTTEERAVQVGVKVPLEVNVCTTQPGREDVLIVPPVACAVVPG